MCLVGVLLTAQPSALFGSSASSSSISRTGVAVGIAQVSVSSLDDHHVQLNDQACLSVVLGCLASICYTVPVVIVAYQCY